MLVPPFAEYCVSTGFMVVATIALAGAAVLLLSGLFAPGLRYKVESIPSDSLDSKQFVCTVEALTDSKVNRGSRLTVLTNGDQFYEAELAAIRSARHHVNLEAYIFHRGETATRFIAAMTERARAGVEVRVVLDALGSLGMRDSDFAEFKKAGGKLASYHALRWHNFFQLNNRTHRELLIVDGRTGFIGGAGIADHWARQTPPSGFLRWLPGKNKPNGRWRDTMVRVEGDAVPNLQATFAENWLEASGEVIAGPRFFPECEDDVGSKVLVVNSTPTEGGATRARILFQLVMAAAQESLDICTPYFLPDRSLIEEITRAARRGVKVRIIVPGKHSDHMLTRSSSRRAYGLLLKAGVRIFEYQPAMIHAKILIADRRWGIVGSTNCDNRSFGLNDEVNLAAQSPEFAGRLEQDFLRDLANSEEITYEKWRRRSFFERGPEFLGWILERQQ